jgi:hypothetical protein
MKNGMKKLLALFFIVTFAMSNMGMAYAEESYDLELGDGSDAQVVETAERVGGGN